MNTPHPNAEGQITVLYTAHERFWHWAQAALIFGLLLTGAALRYPSAFGVEAALPAAVLVHNVLAGLLLVHAALGLFYFVTTGNIRHYVLRREGLREGLVKQVVYYGYGIFRGCVHPFTPTRRARLNLLQRLSYLALLNVLLPAQIITGLLIYFASDVPEIVAALGGLPVLMPLHAVVAWSLLAFVVMHVYLTTTGHTPTEHLRTIITGEAHGAEEEAP